MTVDAFERSKSVPSSENIADRSYFYLPDSQDRPKTPLKSTEPIRSSGGKITAAVYADGQRQFGYDLDGELNSITQPDGTVWKRKTGTDSWNGGISKVSVDDKGNLSFNSWQGEHLVRTTVAAGTKSPQMEAYTELLGEDLEKANRLFFNKIDTNGDGKLSRFEIEEARKNSKREDISFNNYLDILAAKYDDLRNLSGAQFGLTSKISLADMTSCAQREQKLLTEERNWQTARAVLSENDIFAESSPFDGKITARTVEKSRDDKERSANDHEAISFLERQIGNERVSRQDLNRKEEDFVRSDDYEFLTNMRTLSHDLSERNHKLGWLYAREAGGAAALIGLTALTYATGGLSAPTLYAFIMGETALTGLDTIKNREKIQKSYWNPRLKNWDEQIKRLKEARLEAHSASGN